MKPLSETDGIWDSRETSSPTSRDPETLVKHIWDILRFGFQFCWVVSFGALVSNLVCNLKAMACRAKRIESWHCRTLEQHTGNTFDLADVLVVVNVVMGSFGAFVS